MIAKEIEDIGFRCIPLTEKEENLPFTPKPKSAPITWWYHCLRFLSSHWLKGSVGAILGLIVLALSIFIPGLSLTAMLLIGVVSTVLTLWLGFPSYRDAWMKLWKAKTLTMDSLFAVSTLITLVVSIFAFFIPWLPMMFEAGLLVFGFRHIGLAIEESIKNKIEANKRFQHRLPKLVNIWINDHQTERCSPSTIKCDDI